MTAIIKKDKPHIKHRFDPWHLAKSVRKDLVAASKKKECANLVPWISFIVTTYGRVQRRVMGTLTSARRSGKA